MTPIEKSRAQECALQILKVKRQARQNDIKTAWRRRVMETHPDRNSGDDSQFQLVQAAYEIAKGTAADDMIARVIESVQTEEPRVVAEASAAETPQGQAQSKPRRARIKTRLVWVHGQDAAQSGSGKPKKVATVQLDKAAIQYVDYPTAANAAAPAHVEDVHTVQRVRQKGRRVSYIIRSTVKPGSNQVSLPTGDFRSAGGNHEVALQFASAGEGPATVSIPEDTREAHFPGAQSVRVHFSHGADTRP